jgi:hypothetical protein
MQGRLSSAFTYEKDRKKSSCDFYISHTKLLNCPIRSNYTSLLPPGCDTMVVIHNSFLRISSSSSYIFHGVGPLVDPFRSQCPEASSKVCPASFCETFQWLKFPLNWFTGPEQGESSGRVATFSVCTGVFKVGISSIPGETVIPLWLGRHFLVCENRVHTPREGEDVCWVG